jgi:ABC-type multidrug transport system fused ATPase/permease subunit
MSGFYRMNGGTQTPISSAIRNLVGATWMSTKGDRVRFFSFIGLALLALAGDFLLPVALGSIFDVFVDKGFTPQAFELAFYWIGLYVGLRMLVTGTQHWSRYLGGTTSYTTRFRKLQQVFSSLISFPLKWHVHHHTGENLSKLNRSVGAIESVINNYTWQIVEGMFRFALAASVIFYMDMEVAGTVLLLGFLTIFVMLSFNSRLTKTIRLNNRFYDKQNRTCADYLNNIITVKTLRLEAPAVSYLTEHREEGFALSKKIWKYQELKWGTIDVGQGLIMGTALLIYFNNHIASPSSFSTREVFVLIDYLGRIFGAISSFTGYYGGVIEAAIAYDDASSLLTESEDLKIAPMESRLPRNWSKVGLRDIEFSYGSDMPILKAVSLDIRRGEKVAFVGPSGGGKSTLLKILAGMLVAHSGRVECDGHSGELSVDDISCVTLMIPQEPEIFSETVRFNLSFGQDFSTEQLQKAVELCRIDHILKKLPNGWDSDLEEAGLNISVGERQRLALARGILRAPGKDILLLDEPTSSLDPMTEKQIFHGLLHEFSQLTVITACHRLALVPMFDKIVYIREGRIEEVGTFPELRAAGKGFAAAWEDYERLVVSGEQAA